MKIKVPFVDNPVGACAIYALANLFGEPSIIANYPARAFGYIETELSSILYDVSGGACLLAPLAVLPRAIGYLTGTTFRYLYDFNQLTKDLEKLDNYDESYLISFIVYLRRGENLHAVLCFYSPELDSIVYIDSAGKGKGVEYDREAFFDLYRVCSVNMVVNSQKQPAALFRADLSHLFEID